MEPMSMSRRRLLASGAGLAAFPYLASSPEAAAAAKKLRLDDPAARARVRASIIGSTVAQDVHGYSRLHIYAHQSGQKALPLCSMMNYTVTRWQPMGDGRFQGRHYEVGVYTEFDSDTPITHWVKWLGNISAVALVVGGLLLWLNRRSTGDKLVGVTTAFDRFFLWVVLTVIVTGVLTEILRFIAVPPILGCAVYLIHLAIVLTLFLTLPYSKFAHILYRTLAMAHERLTET